jgi:cyanophycinase-like exopeptidase
VDEDTALLFEPGSSRARVHGTGQVTLLYWRDAWHERELRAGDLMDLESLYN